VAEGILVPGISTPDQGSSGIASEVVDIPQQPPISVSVLVARGSLQARRAATAETDNAMRAKVRDSTTASFRLLIVSAYLERYRQEHVDILCIPCLVARYS
jgi:hypothetical protein